MNTEESRSELSALLSFTASNVRSFRDEFHFSMLASRYADQDVVHRLRSGSAKPQEVLPAAGIFGANASGKTALLLALADMQTIVLDSFRNRKRPRKMGRLPFQLEAGCRSSPSRFEIDLIVEGVRWQYGFEVDDERVLGEYAYHYPKGRQALVFDRTEGDISFGSRFRTAGRGLSTLTREDSLLLSVAGAARAQHLTLLYEWFQGNLLLAQSSNLATRVGQAANKVATNSALKHRIASLLHAADLGVSDIEHVDMPPEVANRVAWALQRPHGDAEISDHDLGVEFEDLVRLKHEGTEGDVWLDPEFESQGTRAWVGLIGPVLHALRDGFVLLVDELHASLHPELVALLVGMFQEPRLNPRCAQLIFNTHDATLLGDSARNTLGRDQLWFTEKDIGGATTVYSLVDFRPRRDEALGRRYLQGRFGAVPIVDHGEVNAALDLVNT